MCIRSGSLALFGSDEAPWRDTYAEKYRVITRREAQQLYIKTTAWRSYCFLCELLMLRLVLALSFRVSVFVL